MGGSSHIDPQVGHQPLTIHTPNHLAANNTFTSDLVESQLALAERKRRRTTDNYQNTPHPEEETNNNMVPNTAGNINTKTLASNGTEDEPISIQAVESQTQSASILGEAPWPQPPQAGNPNGMNLSNEADQETQGTLPAPVSPEFRLHSNTVFNENSSIDEIISMSSNEILKSILSWKSDTNFHTFCHKMGVKLPEQTEVLEGIYTNITKYICQSIA